MKAVLVIDMPSDCINCDLYRLGGCQAMNRVLDYQEIRLLERPSWCPLKPLNKIVKAGDRNLIIYERAWLYSHLEEEFEMQKKARDWEKQNDSRSCKSTEATKNDKGTDSCRHR